MPFTNDPSAVPSPAPADWFRVHAVPLTGLDADLPLDDLEPLRDVAGDARVVAVGENAHFVTEFSAARRRVTRFLAERCGFTVVALEFGFSEGFAVDDWLRGAGGDDLAAVSPAAAEWGAADLLHWLRRYNRATGRPLRFSGVDVPEAGGALRPALEPVAAYLREVDPDAVPLVESVLEIGDRFLGGSGASAGPAWGRLATAEQDALTAGLARLLLRVRAVEPVLADRGGQDRFDVARRRVEAACHTDYMFQAMHALMSGRGRAADLSVREVYLAESVRWLLDRDPEARIVLVSHNNHIQKTPAAFDGGFVALTMGLRLHRALGADYRTVGLTHTGGTVPEMYPDPDAEVGFTVAEAPLPEPEPGSVEAGLVAAGLGGVATLTDLRGPGTPPLDTVRTQSALMRTPVAEAFDAVLSVPSATRDPSVRF